MSLGTKSFPAILIVIGIPGLLGLALGQEKTAAKEKRPVSVADAIGMTRIAGSG